MAAPKGNNFNPTGKGGFVDNPQNRSNGRWNKENSFNYWLNYFKSLTVEEFKKYEQEKPDDKRTVSESLAYVRVHNARNELAEFKEVADRSEGKAIMRSEVEIKEPEKPILGGLSGIYQNNSNGETSEAEQED